MDRRKFWKDKWLKEHTFSFVFIGILTIAVVLFLRWRKLIEMSDLGWVALFLILVVVDLLHFIRIMREYVNSHLQEEEEKGITKDGFSLIAEDDPRLVDIDDQ